MQLGVIGAVPLVAILALATRRLRLALDAVLAAGSIYLIAKLVKEFVQRGRPQTLLDGVNILGEPARGLGYVSGHSAGGRRPGHGVQPVPGPAGPAGRLDPGRLRLPGPHVRRGAPARSTWSAGPPSAGRPGRWCCSSSAPPTPRPSLAKLRAVLTEHGLDPTGLSRSAATCAARPAL
jgi:hypothetical protein